MTVDCARRRRAHPRLRGEHIENIGAFPTWIHRLRRLRRPFLSNAYKIPKIGYASQAVYTNTCGKAPYRGPCLMYTVAREQMMDTAARQLGIDPLELRRRNVIRAEDLPYTMPEHGLRRDHARRDARAGRSMIGYDAFRAEQAGARDQGRFLGIGLGLYVEPSAMALGNLAARGRWSGSATTAR